MQILLIEDDQKISSFISKGLKQAGFTVDYAEDGEDGLNKFLSNSYSAAILDLMLPKIDGLELLSEIRKKGIHTPVIILSAKRAIDDRIKGLHTGGDDYLTKPFSFSELLARIEALIRRNTRDAEPTQLTFGALSMNLLSREVTRGDKKIELQSREFSLLEYFLRNQGNVLSKTMIMENVWGYDFDPQTNVVDVLVCRLRNKVDNGFNQKIIHTIRGVGYALKNS